MNDPIFYLFLLLCGFYFVSCASLYAISSDTTRTQVQLNLLDTSSKLCHFLFSTQGISENGTPFVSRGAEVFAATHHGRTHFLLKRDDKGAVNIEPITPNQDIKTLQLDKKTGQLLGLTMLNELAHIQRINDDGIINSTLLKFTPNWFAYEPIASLCYACRKFFAVLYTKDRTMTNLVSVDLDSGKLVANNTIDFKLKSLIMDPEHRELFGLVVNKNNPNTIDVVTINSMEGKIGQEILTIDRNDLSFGGSIDADNQILYLTSTKPGEVIIVDIKAKQYQSVLFKSDKAVSNFNNIAFWK
jgi:hypothetical protein